MPGLGFLTPPSSHSQHTPSPPFPFAQSVLQIHTHPSIIAPADIQTLPFSPVIADNSNSPFHVSSNRFCQLLLRPLAKLVISRVPDCCSRHSFIYKGLLPLSQSLLQHSESFTIHTRTHTHFHLSSSQTTQAAFQSSDYQSSILLLAIYPFNLPVSSQTDCIVSGP